jgi:hypothetical protein
MGSGIEIGIASLVIGAVGSAYSAKKQSDASKKQTRAITSAGKEQQ